MVKFPFIWRELLSERQLRAYATQVIAAHVRRGCQRPCTRHQAYASLRPPGIRPVHVQPLFTAAWAGRHNLPAAVTTLVQKYATVLCRELQAAAGAAPSPQSRRLHQAAPQAGTSARPASTIAPDPRSDPDVASMDAVSANTAATAEEGGMADFEEADEGPDMVDSGTMERAGDLFVAGTAAYPDPTGAFRNVRGYRINLHGISARVTAICSAIAVAAV